MSLRGRLLSVGLALLLALPLPAAADWQQEGYDAARTGAVPGSFPEWPDVAFEIRLPNASDYVVTAPVLLGRDAFVLIPASLDLALPDGLGVGNRTPSIVYRINLDNATVSEFARADWSLTKLASDGLRLVGFGRGRAYIWGPQGDAVMLPLQGNVVNDEAVWPSTRLDMCGEPAIADGIAYIGCLALVAGGAQPFVAAIDLAAGALRWSKPLRDAYANYPSDVVASCLDGGGCTQSSSFLFAGADQLSPKPPVLSVIGDMVYAASNTVARAQRYGSEGASLSAWTLHAIETADGTPHVLEGDAESELPQYAYSTRPFEIPAPTGTTDALYTKNWYVRKYDAPNPAWNSPHRDADFRDSYEGDLGAGFALGPDRLYVASLHSIAAFDLQLNRQPEFQVPLLPADEAWDAGPLLLAGDALLARSAIVNADLVPSHSALYLFHAGTGRLLWRYSMEQYSRVAVGDGVIVTLGLDGLVQVLGTTAASLKVHAAVSSTYPTLEDEFTVGLSATGNDLAGGPTEFSADWGDGATTPWQPTGHMTHRYTSNGDAHARFFTRNPANQTASLGMTLFVGRVDESVRIWDDPWSARYQNTSFFILGLVGTALAALFGVARAGRKRRRLHRELRDLEAAFQRLQDNPSECDRMLSQRKTAARALFLERRLEEAHASFLAGRIDELRRGLRLEAVDTRLKFLPHGMVLHLQKLLADAHIDAYEREHFLAALKRESTLTNRQRAEVVRLIDSWFARDAGAKA